MRREVDNECREVVANCKIERDAPNLGIAENLIRYFSNKI
jgi:hypothetical protein